MGVRLICIVLVLFTVFGCDRKKSTDEENTNTVYRDNYTTVSKDEDDRLEISDVVWQFNESDFSNLAVSGKAKNTGTVILYYAGIHVKAYDSKDALISESYTDLPDSRLSPGAEATWNIVDFDCKIRPTKVTVGYSYTAEIVVPPEKSIVSP